MKIYTLTYGRTVILKREIAAETEEEALAIAIQLENDGQLGNLLVEIDQPSAEHDDSWVESIEDDETIWDIESDDQDDWMC